MRTIRTATLLVLALLTTPALAGPLVPTLAVDANNYKPRPLTSNYKPRPLTSQEAAVKDRVVGLVCSSPLTPQVTWRFVEANPGNNAVRVIYQSPTDSVRPRLYVEGNRTRFRGTGKVAFNATLSSLRVESISHPGTPLVVPCSH